MIVVISTHREILFAGPIDDDGLVIGAAPACDVRFPIQGSITVQVKGDVLEIYQIRPHDSQRYSLKAGASKTLLGMEIRAFMSRPGDASLGPSITDLHSTTDSLAWLQRFCNQPSEYDALIRDWLAETRGWTRGRAAAFLKFDLSGDVITAWDGCALAEAEVMVRSVPEGIRTEILRTGAQVILPNELNTVGHNSVSIRIDGMRGTVGIAVRFGSQTHGIAFFAFANVIADFTIHQERRLSQESQILAMALQLTQPNAAVREARSSQPQSGALGSSQALREVYDQIRKVAPSRIAVLITGQTGTGKELAAQEIHRSSDRGQGPMICISGAAIPRDLAEAELFGYVRGAFTGAVRDRVGVFERASGGTLLIDEVGELALDVQAKLLRAIQEGVIVRVGEHRERKVDVRLICATHRDLTDMVVHGSFRADLLYRIAGAQINLPALSERLEDIPVLVQAFTEEFCVTNRLPSKIWTPSALTELAKMPWPGNIRQLRNAVERIVILSDANEITVEAVGYGTRNGAKIETAKVPAPNLSLDAAKEDFIRQHLTHALNQHDWNKKATAKALGIGLRSLFRYIEELSVKR